MNSAIVHLLSRTLLWMPLCFGAWYFTASSHAALLGGIIQLVVNATYPIVVPMIQKESALEFQMEIPAALSPRTAGREGVFKARITIDVLIYGCGIPLFLALMLGTKDPSKRWKKLAIGLAIWFVYELIAIYIAIGYNTLNIFHLIGADTRWLFGLPWSPYLNLLAQTTFALVLPSALAIFLWAGLNPGFLKGNVTRM